MWSISVLLEESGTQAFRVRTRVRLRVRVRVRVRVRIRVNARGSVAVPLSV
jgi:hypothetical protein